MDVSTGSIFCCEDDDVVAMFLLIRCRPTTDTAGTAAREKRVTVPAVVTKCDEEAKARAGVKAATDDEKGEDVKASKDAAKREPSNALL
jgi:hypothetical protein